jgi:iron complex outermembrane receptor protein
LDGYRIAPVLRYLGQRYVDVQNQYSIGANWLMDLSVAKSVAMGDGHKLEFSLNVMNLFDRKYISTISTSDLNTTLNGPSYMVGGTRSVFASVQYKY